MSELSVLIPTRNNLEYLKLALRGLEKHSVLENELIIHVDGSTDGTVEWLKERDYEFSFDEWKGVYHGWNACSKQATRKYQLLYSDDMFPAPEWDASLIGWLSEDNIVIPRLVEPNPGSYPPPYDCGRTATEFDEEKFIRYVEQIKRKEVKFHTFGAFCVPRERYRAISGYDERFGPVGVGSIDFILRYALAFPNVKFLEAQDMIFYHFSRAAFSKIPEREQLCERSVTRFVEKWGHDVGEAYQRLEQMRENL